MSLLEIIFISVGLAMDAFAVAVCKGLSMKKMNWKNAIIIAIWFGIFQALMPFIGYILGNSFEKIVITVDHWIAFIFLLFIGGNMIKDSFNTETDKNDDKIDFKTMIILAIATSIDALAVGITFAFFNINIIRAISFIGIITTILSLIGVKIGNKFGDKYKNKAQFFGGTILICIGINILLEHLML